MQCVSFCTTISVFCEIYTLRMRVVAHAAIVWVGWFFYAVLRSWASICPHHWCGTREIWTFWEGLRRRLGKFWCPWVVCIDRLDVATCRVTRWLGRGCRAAWLGVGCSGQPVGQGAHVDVVVVLGLCGGLSAAFFMFWRQRGPSAFVMVSTGRWGLCAFCCWC